METFVNITTNLSADVIRFGAFQGIPVVLAGESEDAIITVEARALVVGNAIIIDQVDHVVESVEIVEIGSVATDILNMTQEEQRLRELEARVTQLEESLIAANNALTNVNATMVELTASHIQNLFSNEVLLDSLSQRILIAGANAIAFKAKQSRQRAPELIVVEGYVPGSIRVTLTDAGVVIEEQLKESQEWVSGEDASGGFNDEKVINTMGDLLIGYGAEHGRAYYVVDSVVLQEFRENAAKTLGQITQVATDAAESGIAHAAQ